MTATGRPALRSGDAHGRGGMRAMRGDDAETQVARRMEALGRGLGPAGGRRAARALRAERRAAQRGGPGYDPLRHLALARLARRPRGSRRG